MAATGNLKVSGGSLTGNGGAAKGDNESNSTGISALTITVSGGSLTGNSNTSEANYALSYGMYTPSLSIQGGTVTANGNNATGGDEGGSFSSGVAANGGLSVSGGSLKATGGEAALQPDSEAYAQSCGIYAEADTISFSGGTVEATGGKAGNSSFGIRNAGIFDKDREYESGGGITVSGTADVTANGDTAEDSFGLWCRGAGLAVSGGKLTAAGGAGTEFSTGVCASGDSSNIKVTGGKLTAQSENAKNGTGALNKALALGSGVTAKGSTSSDGSEPLNYVGADNDTYKWVSVTERPAMPSDDDDDDYTPSPVTVYNDPSVPNATIWLTGKGLAANDLLVTRRDPAGSAYQALLKLAEGSDVFATYSISLRSGSKNYGSAMHLTFDLNGTYAGQDFTLVHQKASGAYEYFYDTADAAGDLTFGPLYELSPFMLVEGTLSPTAEGAETNPNTGVSAAPALLLGLALVAGVGLAAGVKSGREKQQNG